MQLTALIDAIDAADVVALRGDVAMTEVSGIEFDSREVRPGALFCCVPGARTDGHRHAGEAIARGAAALMCEHPVDGDVPQMQVRAGRLRPAMAEASAALYGHPARSMTTVGVTGTNGKTTVTSMIAWLLEASGVPTGMVGTLDGARTTPESPELQRRLAEFRDQRRGAVTMEVSSHALTQHRVDGMTFDVAVFTNLSRDHLDHHGSMEEYFAAKASLFEPARSRLAVVSVDDRWGRLLADRLGRRGCPPLVTVGRQAASGVRASIGSSSLTWRGRPVTVPLTGSFNIDNALVSAEVAVALGIGPDVVAESLSTVPPVPGRMELVSGDGPVSVLVDYAHTPAGLDVALASLRALAGAGRVICVFGCGGDRDRGKRPEMGHAAARWSDLVVLTSDNPRSEDPDAIIADVLAGMAGPAEVVVEPDRAAAIGLAVDRARPGDIVLLAGKGHETDQVVAGVGRPFDDRAEARRVLAHRFGGAVR